MTMPFTTPIIISPVAENGWRTIWRVIEPLNFHSDKFAKNYVVPAGCITDLKSGLRRDASAAAILHDHLYNWGVHFKQIKDRQEADDVFLEAMQSSGVAPWRAWLYFVAVRLFGKRYYKPIIEDISREKV